MRHLALIALVSLSLSACLAKTLRVPVEDHYVQTETIATWCREGKYGECSAELQEDLDAMAKQAEYLNDIVKNRKPSP